MDAKQIWFSPKRERLYLLPDSFVFIPGSDQVENDSGAVKYVNFDHLKDFQVSEEEAYLHLRAKWEKAVEGVKAAWEQLSRFSSQQQQKNDFQLLFNRLPELDQDALSATRKHLDELFTEDDQNEVVQTANGLIREIIGKVLSDLPQDPENLEAWSQDLHRRFFAEEIDRKEKKRQQELKESIGNSIARRLRERGVTPSRDFDQS